MLLNLYNKLNELKITCSVTIYNSEFTAMIATKKYNTEQVMELAKQERQFANFTSLYESVIEIYLL